MDSFEVVVGIIVFISWIFSSVFGNKRKKKTTPRPTKNNGAPSPQHESRPGLLEEIKRSIRTVMEEVQETQQPDVLTSEMTSEESFYDNDRSLENVLPEVVKVDEKIPSIVNLKSKPPEISMQIHKAAGIKTISCERLREMVIWSEILAPPVAFRDK
jgi:hypothetical protein